MNFRLSAASIAKATIFIMGIAIMCGGADAETLIFHAAQSGKQTLDQGEGGGNPFASALIETLARPRLALSEFPAALKELTVRKSRGFQAPDVPGQVAHRQWLLAPRPDGETRIALVLAVSDYAKSGGAQSLPGVKHDADRVAAALTKAGFATEMALDLDLEQMRQRLSAFAAQSKQHDAALIYTTGHGVEVGGKVFLLPGNYPVPSQNAALSVKALTLSEIASAPQAKSVNLIFYGGCRDSPFGQ
jgi:uncharacterized caspase-like protein